MTKIFYNHPGLKYEMHHLSVIWFLLIQSFQSTLIDGDRDEMGEKGEQEKGRRGKQNWSGGTSQRQTEPAPWHDQRALESTTLEEDERRT